MVRLLPLILWLLSLALHAQPSLIPWPRSVEWLDGRFRLENVSLHADPGLETGTTPLLDYLSAIGAKAPANDELIHPFYLRRDPQLPREGYVLDITPTRAVVRVSDAAGVFNALATLRQMTTTSEGGSYWPCARIADHPAYAWRGTMLDVSRHFYPVNFLERYLDELARLKINIFHWHLTDDQGWRIEVKKYPRLTEVGAWRTEADGRRYGGFYTQEEVKRVVRYAAERGIIVVPEIEFPGHCRAALAAYPGLGCRKDTLPVPTTWGVFQDVYCVGQDATWTFMQDVLDELVPLFPSPYFHIGGDEVPKHRWHACPVCQRRMHAESLPDEYALQAWAVKRLQGMLKAKGKTLIGWDEILEGGVDSAAVIEVWRGDEQARKARANGNAMIRTIYFDASPASLTLERVEQFDPRVDGSDQQVLGAECPAWSEGRDPRNLGYSVFPRLFPYAERLWTGEAPRADIRERMRPHVARVEREGWITATHDADLFAANIRYEAARKDWLVTTQRGRPDITVVFNGPDTSGMFADSLRVPKAGTWSLTPLWRGQPVQDALTIPIVRHLGVEAAQTVRPLPDPKYGFDPAKGMSDGLLGSGSFRDGQWQGWWGPDPVITLDLGQEQAISELNIRCLQDVAVWILLPREVIFETSTDGKHWRTLERATHALPTDPGPRIIHAFGTRPATPAKARYMRATLVNSGPMPASSLGAGNPSWIFADEFVVR
ncbi:MAG: family 20 glycosylhydrolase [Flavobacteriales bacterium]|nr:family 20 glycosylhydrolase [Flavobacteriales bacterium]MEB2342868.1 family 20 glycosylhydrolase [Flavobacteriia bacterium]